jgi:hypothetical protein
MVEQFKNKILEERKNNEKSMISYEAEMKNLADTINLLEREIREKDVKIQSI